MTNVGLIDLDDTLGDLKTPMMHALNRVTDKNIHWSTWTNFNVGELYDLSADDVLTICIDENVLEQVEIYAASYKFLNDLTRAGCYTVLITARGWHPFGLDITKKWMLDHNLVTDELIVIDVNGSKVNAISKFDNIMFSVDDRIKHCREYIQSNQVEHVFIYDAPWNSYMTRWNEEWGGYDYTNRVHNLHEILPHINLVNSEGNKNVC